MFIGPTYYIIDNPFLPWLWPFMALTGLGFQLLALLLHSLYLPAIGFMLICIYSYMEHDISMLMGNLLVISSIYFYLLKK